jgi:glucans biosynthesis protein C
MVLLVLVFHSAASYGSTVEFWPFHDNNPSRTLDLFLFICDTFMMSILFFVAGYFTLPSLRKKGPWAFVGGKLTRLGVPWLVVTVTVLPLLDYIHYRRVALSYGQVIRDYGAHWLLSMKRIAAFHVGWMDMTGYRNMADQFYQRYMWYVSLLILFFVVSAVFWAVTKSIAGNLERRVPEPSVRKTGWYRIAVTAAVAVLLFALIKFFFYENFADKGWFSLGNVFQFQCGKLALYACCFALGVHASSGNWLTRSDSLGHLWVWAVACLLLFGINVVALMMLKKPGGNIIPFQVFHVVFYPLWTFSFLGLFLSFAARRLNWSTPVQSQSGRLFLWDVSGALRLSYGTTALSQRHLRNGLLQIRGGCDFNLGCKLSAKPLCSYAVSPAVHRMPCLSEYRANTAMVTAS